MNTTEVRLLTRKDVTLLLQVSEATLNQLLDDRVLPEFRPLGKGRLLYIREDDYFAAINARLPSAPATVVVPPAAAAPAPVPIASPAPVCVAALDIQSLVTSHSEIQL
jgi:predicted DNA-binding transcriptional regulator AlpA